nr:MAG TPA: hypothetical protein [Inoviridae sp.]
MKLAGHALPCSTGASALRAGEVGNKAAKVATTIRAR